MASVFCRFRATFWVLSFATALVHAQYLITTEAGGGGQITNSSNGGKANSAFVGRPGQLAVDANGNVYLLYGSMLLEIFPLRGFRCGRSINRC